MKCCWEGRANTQLPNLHVHSLYDYTVPLLCKKLNIWTVIARSLENLVHIVLSSANIYKLFYWHMEVNRTDPSIVTCIVPYNPLTWHCLRLPLLTWWAFWESGARFLGELVPLLFSHPSSMWSHPEARNCFLQPARGTVQLLSDLSIGSEYSPRARQTCRVCYQDSLSWFLASPAQIPIHATEERHHCRQRVCLHISLCHFVEAQQTRLTWLLVCNFIMMMSLISQEINAYFGLCELDQGILF